MEKNLKMNIYTLQINYTSTNNNNKAVSIIQRKWENQRPVAENWGILRVRKVLIISQYIHISNHIIYLKLIYGIFLNF